MCTALSLIGDLRFCLCIEGSRHIIQENYMMKMSEITKVHNFRNNICIFIYIHVISETLVFGILPRRTEKGMKRKLFHDTTMQLCLNYCSFYFLIIFS